MSISSLWPEVRYKQRTLLYVYAKLNKYFVKILNLWILLPHEIHEIKCPTNKTDFTAAWRCALWSMGLTMSSVVWHLHTWLNFPHVCIPGQPTCICVLGFNYFHITFYNMQRSWYWVLNLKPQVLKGLPCSQLEGHTNYIFGKPLYSCC